MSDGMATDSTVTTETTETTDFTCFEACEGLSAGTRAPAFEDHRRWTLAQWGRPGDSG